MVLMESGTPTVPFDAAFNSAFDLASASLYGTAWYSIIPGFYAQYRHPEPITDMRYWRLTGIDTEDARYVMPTDDISADPAGTYNYESWSYWHPDSPTHHIRLLEARSILPGDERHRKLDQGSELAFPINVCDNFWRLAVASDQIALIARRMVGWSADIADDVRQHIDQYVLTRTVSALVTRGQLLADDTVPIANSVVGEFAKMDLARSLTHQSIAGTMSKTLGKILLGSQAGNLTERSVAKLNKHKTVEAVSFLDHANTVPDEFWIDFGVLAKIAIKVPDFLPILYDKLEGVEGERILATVDNPQELCGAFITKILESYLDDPHRHRANVSRFLELTRINPRFNTDVSLRQVIAVSNLLPDRPPDTAEFDMTADPVLPLRPEDFRFLGAAVQRILSFTMKDGVEQSEVNKQIAQDQQLTSIVELVMFRGRPKRRLPTARL